MRGSRVYKVVRGRYRVLIEERRMRDGSSIVFVTSDERLASEIAGELERLGLQPRVYTDKYGYWRVRVVVPRRAAATQTAAVVA